MFFRGSRYEGVPAATHVEPDGTLRQYKRLRIVPPPGGSLVHVVRQDDTPDRRAGDWFRDAEQWGRIADANLALDPDALVAAPGAEIAVPAPGETAREG